MTETISSPPEGAGMRRLAPKLLPLLRTVWPWVLLGVLVWLGWHELKLVDLQAVTVLLKATNPELVLTLLAFTALNLALAGFYDVAALGPRTLSPPATTRWSVGVVSFAWSNFLTVGPLAGPALRLWLYRPLGVETGRARRALAAILVTFTLGLVAWCGAVIVPLPSILEGPGVRLLIAAALGWVVAAVWSSGVIPGTRPNDSDRRLPAFRMVAVAMGDWFLAWIVFHMALSGLHGDIPAGESLRVFFLGQLVGLASFIPGGLGSADLFWGFQLSGIAGGHDRVVAALLLYRVVYYVVPFVFANLVLAGHLVRTGRRIAVFVRTALGSYAFVCGAVLLASAASPTLRDRAIFLKETVPLALVEISHGVSIVLGFLLLVLSRGLARGYRSSHRVALALFAAGAAATFAKGLDYEEAILLLVAAALLVVFRRAFDRAGRLHPSVEFVVSTGVFAVLLFAAVGIGSYEAFPSIAQAFEKFEVLGHEQRFIRGLLLLVAIAAAFALRFGQRARSTDALPAAAGIERSLREAAENGRNSNALLVATGDKAIFRISDDSPDFIPHRTAGRFLIAYSDPVCRPGHERELLARFLSYAADADREVILYQVTPAFLPVAHDFGFTFFKLGEEAVVDLRRFDLKGNKAKTWRSAINHVERAGGRFEILSGASLGDRLGELKRVSDDWLARKRTTEKGFSIGRFEETYMRRFPCAVVLDGGGAVVAFANILEGPRGEEISVDLMRHLEPEEGGGLHGAMDYLFLKLMMHGKERGFARFNLGMAPLAAVGEVRWARPIERLARQFFLHGEAWYNYQGLRRFKEKFDPVWEPRYMAYTKPWNWPLAITATTMLISGGWKAWISPRGKSA